MRILIALGIVALLAMPVAADVYNDNTGDILATNAIMDIVSVEVTNTATDITFKLTLNGDVVVTDWGKYLVGMDTVPGGDPAGDGWVRPISMSSGMDYWIGSWVDSGNGAELWKYTGAAWSLDSATYNANPDNVTISKLGSTVTLSTSLASLGLVPGSTVVFDVYTSGGGSGDGAVDALGNNAQTIANWGDPYDSGTNVKTYVVTPEPAALGLLAIGAVGLLRRRRAA